MTQQPTQEVQELIADATAQANHTDHNQGDLSFDDFVARLTRLAKRLPTLAC